MIKMYGPAFFNSTVDSVHQEHLFTVEILCKNKLPKNPDDVFAEYATSSL